MKFPVPNIKALKPFRCSDFFGCKEVMVIFMRYLLHIQVYLTIKFMPGFCLVIKLKMLDVAIELVNGNRRSNRDLSVID